MDLSTREAIMFEKTRLEHLIKYQRALIDAITSENENTMNCIRDLRPEYSPAQQDLFVKTIVNNAIKCIAQCRFDIDMMNIAIRTIPAK